MRIIKFTLIIFTLAFFLQENKSQSNGSFPQEITKATQRGDANSLASFFNDRIELMLPEKSGVFSKEQAQFIMKDFFYDHKPTSFQINHEGVRDNSSYVIGRYVCSKDQFRFYFLTKNVDNKTLIIQIRVDKQDE